jgi:hypothetical protein
VTGHNHQRSRLRRRWNARGKTDRTTYQATITIEILTADQGP